MIGKTISHYRILEKLGEGGMGVVYKAEDTKLKRHVALKFLPTNLTADEEAKERFIQEAQAASALDHPNICTIYEINETEDGQMFIAMAYYGGETLKKKVASGQLSVDSVIDIAIQIAKGLAKAHEHGIVHRDIKPANIIVTSDGLAKILDFGLAKLAGQARLTRTGTTIGTVAYMSPEQVRGEDVDHQTDIWSLGVVLYEMITGKLPFVGDYEQAVSYSIVNEEPKSITGLRPGVPRELERIVDKALAKNADERYQSVDEIIIDLKQIAQDSTTTGMHKPSGTAQKKSVKSRLIKFAIPGVALILLVLGFFILRPLLLKDVLKSAPKPVAVLPFENLTGDSTYNILQKSISNLFIAKLEGSKYLRVTTWERMADLLKQAGKGSIEIVDIDKETSFELCRMDGVDAAVTGSFSKIGQMFAIEVKILDVNSKEILLSETSQGRGENSIFEQIDVLSKTISKGFGLRQLKKEPITKPIEEITTHCMEAYNYYIIGKDNLGKQYYKDALQFFEKALQVDSTFAIAYLWLARTLGALGKDEARNSAFMRAKAYSDNASEKEKLYIEADYAESIENDLDKQLRILKQLTTKFPREKTAHRLLAYYYRDKMGLITKSLEEFNIVLKLDPNDRRSLNRLGYLYLGLGNFDKANEYFKRYISLYPGDADPYDAMGDMYLKMGKFSEALNQYKMAFDIKPDFYFNCKIPYILALSEDYFEAIKWIDQYMSNLKSPGDFADGHLYKGFQYAWIGKINQSFTELDRAQELWQESSWNKSFVEYVKGHVHFDRGEYDNSRACFKEWYRLVLFSQFKESFPVFKIINLSDLGLIDLRQGRIDSAKQKLRVAQTMLPEIIEANKVWATRVFDYFQGEVFLSMGDFEDAIAIFQKIIEETPSIAVDPIIYINTPFLNDGLARSYQEKGDIPNAITEYEKLIGSGLKNRLRLIHPKLHYRLAKLYQETGEKEKAISEYKRFLDLWKEADADLPELIDAKARYTNLIGAK